MRWMWMVTLGGALISVGARAEQLRAPQNVSAEPWNRQSAELATRSAIAEMNGKPGDALALAQEGIHANPDDPWPYYQKGMALAQLGHVDAAVSALAEAERRFSNIDLWGKSIAIYGRAHAYAEAGRCTEARLAFNEYASVVESHDPKSAEMARRYAAECRPVAVASPAPVQSAPPPAAPSAPAKP